MTAVTTEELSAGVQQIFADAVTGTPSSRVEPEKSHTLLKNSHSVSSCVTQHNTTVQYTKRREEKRREEEFDRQKGGW
ncbi:MAG: hypothetical protein WCX22_08430 [Methanoregula sp.]